MILKIIGTDDTVRLWECDLITHSPASISYMFPDTIHVLDAATPLYEQDVKSSHLVKGRFIDIVHDGRPTSIFTNCTTYLMNDNGKTIERL
jgi:hypothetical protein